MRSSDSSPNPTYCLLIFVSVVTEPSESALEVVEIVKAEIVQEVEVIVSVLVTQSFFESGLSNHVEKVVGGGVLFLFRGDVPHVKVDVVLLLFFFLLLLLLVVIIIIIIIIIFFLLLLPLLHHHH